MFESGRSSATEADWVVLYIVSQEKGFILAKIGNTIHVMANVAVIGAQWGDEGKGKIVDWLTSRADVVVRFQGGHNAGHTLVVDGEIYQLSLLPASVVRPTKLGILGNGVVVDPWKLLEEIDNLEKRGISVNPTRLRIAENACLILPLHRELDEWRETDRHSIGTTKRGIGPAYEDKVGRRAVRMADLADAGTLELRLDKLLRHHNALRRGLGHPPVDAKTLRISLKEVTPRLLPYIAPTWLLLDAARRDGQRILFEGAQGVLLDLDHGTYPFVTSSSAVAAQAASGTGIAPSCIDRVLGICKAYCTRVGEGPFPTEQDNDVGKLLGERGHEFGTVTGRPRRCGWFDAVLARQAIRVAGIDGIALTKLDVLDGMKEIKICVGYLLDGERIDRLPAAAGVQNLIEPIYETLDGWQETSVGARSWAQLPAQAVKYVRHVEELIGAPVTLLSTSPERNDVVLMKDPFLD